MSAPNQERTPAQFPPNEMLGGRPRQEYNEQMEKHDHKVYCYNTDWDIYAIAFSSRKQYPIRLALGSFIEEEDNKVEVVQLSEDRTVFERKLWFKHKFPPSKIMWLPDVDNSHPDLLVTSSDTLKVWEIDENQTVKMKCSLENHTQKELAAPLTSFDWNPKKLEIICTSSIDTTCTIWDINKSTSVKQLIAHDKEVFDVSFSPDSNIFATVGADGSARQFDIRDLTKSDILFETTEPLLRVAWNKNNQNYIAIIEMHKEFVTLVDIRKPFSPACKLYYHKKPVNYLTWAPHSPNHICTVSDDKQALIWDLGDITPEITAPLLEYSAEDEITNVTWSSLQTDWVGLCFNKQLQILRVY